MNGSRSSDPVDPLQDYTGLALFPTIFKVLPDPSNPYVIDHDLHVIHNHLKSMDLQLSPSKLKYQEKNIVTSTSEILKSGNQQASKQNNEVVREKDEENPRQRRPALDRKRSRFSMKPNSSQPARSLVPRLDVNNLKDPVEFWKAYERNENADKEIEKQMGDAELDADLQNPSSIKRRRRPAILGRAAKKHDYPLSTFETNENVMSSQDIFETSIPSPLEEVDLAGPTADPDENQKVFNEDKNQKVSNEDKNQKVFDELLSGGVEVASLLQEYCNIKPIKPQKSHSLPEDPSVKVDFKSSRRTGPMSRDVLADIDSITAAKRRKGAEGSIHLLSPTPPKSPLSSIFAFKRSLLPNSSSDPFSAHDIDRLPVKNSSLVENGNEQSDLVNMGEQTTVSDDSLSPLIEQTDNTVIVQSGSAEVAIDKFSHAFERSASEDSSKLDGGIDVGSHRSHVHMEDNIGGSNMDHKVVEDNTLRSPAADTDTWENEANDVDTVNDELEDSPEPELNVADSSLEKNNTRSEVGQIHSTAVEENPTDGLSRNLDSGPETHNEIMQEQSGVSLNTKFKANSRPRRKQKSKNVSKRKSIADKLHSEAVEEHPVDDLSRTLNPVPEIPDQIMQDHSGVSPNEQNKANSPPHRKQKRREVSRRQSLAGAGTVWQSGVRRSTRIKTRPLEYWKGERLLYGRVHESLVTVIGMKYASPGKGDGRAPLKVKSFVSDEYKELVELASLH